MAVVGQDTGNRSLRASKRQGDAIFRGVTFFFAAIVIAAAAALAISIVLQAWPALQQVGFGVLGGTTWDPNHHLFGGLSFIYGTFVTSLVALVFAGVIGLMVAIFLVEMAPPFISRPVSFLVEMLAAVPSVIFGLWGIFVLIPLVTPVEAWINAHLGFIPLFSTPGSSTGSLMIAALVLAIMILPTVAALSRDVMNSVPGSQREGMLALGATKWEVIRNVVIPYARAGIIGALVLALGRAIGETMAVTMVIGNSTRISSSLFSGGYSIAAVLANEAQEALSDPLHIGSLFELGLLLLLISVLLNALARLLVGRLGRLTGGPGR